MTFKEIKLHDEDTLCTPVTIVSSVYDAEGNPYEEHTHDQYCSLSKFNSVSADLTKRVNNLDEVDHSHYTSDINSLNGIESISTSSPTIEAGDGLNLALAKLSYANRLLMTRKVSITGRVSFGSNYERELYLTPGCPVYVEMNITREDRPPDWSGRPGRSLLHVYGKSSSSHIIYLAHSGNIYLRQSPLVTGGDSFKGWMYCIY